MGILRDRCQRKYDICRRDAGSDTAGNTYSFGAASSTECAFGGLLSSNLVPTIGVQFQNAMGGTITSLAVQYTLRAVASWCNRTNRPTGFSIQYRRHVPRHRYVD